MGSAMVRKKAALPEWETIHTVREKARKAVSFWTRGKFGTQSAVPQESLRRAIGTGLGDVARRYPMAIRKDGRKNVWDMGLLEKSLRFDDPVTMLSSLGPADSGSWRAMLEQVEAEGCTTDQEATIRKALLRMMLPVHGTADPAGDPWAAGWALYRENMLRRKA